MCFSECDMRNLLSNLCWIWIIFHHSGLVNQESEVIEKSPTCPCGNLITTRTADGSEAWGSPGISLARSTFCCLTKVTLVMFKGQVMKTDPNDQDKWAMQHITYPVLPPSSSSWPSPPRAALSPPPPDIQFIPWWYNYMCIIASFYRFSNKLQTDTLSLNFFAS